MNFLHVEDESEAAPGEFYMLPGDSGTYLRVRAEWPEDAVMLAHDCAVAGVSKEDRDIALTRWMLGRNRSLELKRDRWNRHDPNAVKVYARWTGWFLPHRKHIGYIPKRSALKISEALKKRQVHAWAKTVFPPVEEGKSPGIRMKVGYVEGTTEQVGDS